MTKKPTPTKKATALKGRRYPVPANYPVPTGSIPDMPIEVFHLLTTGHVMATEREDYGFGPMTCATCAGPIDLILRRDPTPPDALLAATRTKKGLSASIPGTVWGEHVTVICRCCSFATCPHCLWHGELVVGHVFNEYGRCTRCGHASQVTNHQLTHRLEEFDRKTTTTTKIR